MPQLFTLNEENSTPSTARIEAFSDAVMAIIMTLLVLEITVPSLSESFTSAEALVAFQELLPKFLSFAMSFLIIAIVWVNHHHFFHRLKAIDRGLLWLNNLLLFWLCFIPFPTAFIGEHPISIVPVVLYGFVLFAVASSFVIMHYYAYYQSLFYKDISIKFLERENRRGLIAPTLYLFSMIIAPFSVVIALSIFLIVPVLYFLPVNTVKV